jgi:hypothetical protein
MLRALVLFFAVAIAHFALSVAGLLLVLPAAFEAQGAGFWAAPGKVTLVWVSSALLAPVAWLRGPDFGFLDIAAASALAGAAAVAIARPWRAKVKIGSR